MSIAIQIAATAFSLLAVACAGIYWLYRCTKKDLKEESARADALEKDLHNTEVFGKLRWAEEHAKREQAEFLREHAELWRVDLQDKLSSALCPRNDHLWESGVCKRCGRPQGWSR